MGESWKRIFFIIDYAAFIKKIMEISVIGLPPPPFYLANIMENFINYFMVSKSGKFHNLSISKGFPKNREQF